MKGFERPQQLVLEAHAAPPSVAHTPQEATVARDPIDAAMDRYADGDELAFGDVYRALAPRIHAFLRRLSGRTDIADDLTQETFLRMHRARGSFGSGRAVIPWAYAIARNCYLDSVRVAARLPVSASEQLSEQLVAGPEASAEEQVLLRRTAECVDRTLRSMTPARREAFVLLRYEGLSVETAARVLGITEGALKLRAFHAYELLRQALHALEADT